MQIKSSVLTTQSQLALTHALRVWDSGKFADRPSYRDDRGIASDDGAKLFPWIGSGGKVRQLRRI